MDLFRRLLAALIFPGILALWMIPSAQAVEGTPAAHAPDFGQPTLALDASPLHFGGAPGGIEPPEDERDRLMPRGVSARGADLQTTDVARPARATRERSAGPIYTVRRSGQAHRSAP